MISGEDGLMHALHPDEPVVIDDPRAAKALAHPTRLEILEYLNAQGESTVTQLAEALGESTASMSYHVGQLARFGFVARAVGEGRHKPWRRVNVTYTFGYATQSDGTDRHGVHDLVDVALKQGAKIVDEFVLGQSSLPNEWQRATVLANRTCYVTPDELHEVAMQMLEHLDRFQSRTAADKPAGARPAHFLLRAVPAMPAAEDGPTYRPTAVPDDV